MDSNVDGRVKSWLQLNMAEAWRIRRNSQLRASFGMSDKHLGRTKGLHISEASRSFFSCLQDP